MRVRCPLCHGTGFKTIFEACELCDGRGEITLKLGRSLDSSGLAILTALYNLGGHSIWISTESVCRVLEVKPTRRNVERMEAKLSELKESGFVAESPVGWRLTDAGRKVAESFLYVKPTREVLSQLRKEDKQILKEIALSGKIRTPELVRRLRMPKSTVHLHLNKLHKMGLIIKLRKGISCIWQLSELGQQIFLLMED